MRVYTLAAAAMLMTSGAALAAETIAYKYDARGRLVQVVRAGGPSPGTVNYQYDKANNRTVKTTS